LAQSPCSSATKRSKTTNDVGVSDLSLATREADGWRRSISAEKSRPSAPATTSSPSSTNLGDRTDRTASTTSGKYRVRDRRFRDQSATSEPTR
jgi:hypothetical protein